MLGKPLNDDQNLETAVTADGITPLLENGDGSIACSETYANRLWPGGIAMGDLSGNAKSDLVSRVWIDESVYVSLHQ